jgi:hypothetical protein
MRTFNNIVDIGVHYDTKHHDQLPEGVIGEEFHYQQVTGKTHGNCIVCKQPTKWNIKTHKYHRFCEKPECKQKYREEFKKRMIGKYGKITLLNDPEKQKEMLANRKISGSYIFQDGSAKTYTGTYEKDFLEFLDEMLDWDSKDVESPSPHVYRYTYEGQEKFYIPDMYLYSLNREIEIKDGGDNPNQHHKIQDVDKVKEGLKDKLLASIPNVNYLKIVNKENNKFLLYLDKVKEQAFEGKNVKIYMI